MIRIITDSTSDLTDRARELGIDVLPLSVHFGEEVFRDGVDLTNEQFYEKLSDAQELPKTSQVSPEAFAALYRRCIEAGDQVVGIFIASELSGTCQSAAIARDMVDPEQIFVVDSRSATAGEALLVMEALRLRAAGAAAAEIADALNALAQRTQVFICTSTLKYLKMGGRISPEAAEQGTLMGISPIVSVRGGTVSLAGKARGQKAACQWMLEQLESCPPDLEHPVFFFNGSNPTTMEQLMAQTVERYPFSQVNTNTLGAVIGTHVGPGSVGFAYIAKE